MSTKDFSVLRKAMMRTTSDNDAEALLSIRRANLILATHTLTWDKVFDRVVTVVNEVDADPNDPTIIGPHMHAGAHSTYPTNDRHYRSDDPNGDLDRLFDDAMGGAAGDFLETLESIHAHWEEKGWISKLQRDVVERAAERYAERHPGGRSR